MLRIKNNYFYQKKSAYLLIIIGLYLALFAVILVTKNQETKTQPQPTLQTKTSSTKISKKKIDEYKVAPDAPKYIEIPAISIPKTRIIGLGLMKNNEVAVPNNINDTGWYNRSAKPGKTGVMFIYGHVSGSQDNGIFYNLKKLKSGNKITVIRGDDKSYIYEVREMKTYPYDKVDMNQVLSPISPNKHALTLMTCSGNLIKNNSEFSQRLVVFSSLIK